MQDVYRWAALAAVVCLLGGCASMTPEATAAVAVTASGALVEFVASLAPMLKPEEAAELQVLAGNVQTVVDATALAMGQVAQTVAELRQAEQANEAATWSGAELAGYGSAAAAAVAAGTSRLVNVQRDRKYKAPLGAGTVTTPTV